MLLDTNKFNKIIDTEEYFEFFRLPYDPNVVHVNRLHILKLFSQYIHEVDANNPEASQSEKLDLYCAALKEAYEFFLSSTPLEKKLFKVFNQKHKNIVMLTEIATD